MVNTVNSTQSKNTGYDWVDLTVRSGYNMMLYYSLSMIYTWSQFTGCDNASLDGFLLSTVMPYFTMWIGQDVNLTVLAGMFIAEEVFFNDSVVVVGDVKSAGMGLGSWSSWIVVSIAWGSLGYVVL